MMSRQPEEMHKTMIFLMLLVKKAINTKRQHNKQICAFSQASSDREVVARNVWFLLHCGTEHVVGLQQQEATISLQMVHRIEDARSHNWSLVMCEN